MTYLDEIRDEWADVYVPLEPEEIAHITEFVNRGGHGIGPAKRFIIAHMLLEIEQLRQDVAEMQATIDYQNDVLRRYSEICEEYK